MKIELINCWKQNEKGRFAFTVCRVSYYTYDSLKQFALCVCNFAITLTIESK
jgi:hypothetical protein